MSHFLADVKNLKGLVPKKKAERAGLPIKGEEKQSQNSQGSGWVLSNKINLWRGQKACLTSGDDDSPLIGGHIWGRGILLIHVASVAHLRDVVTPHQLVAFPHTAIYGRLPAAQIHMQEKTINRKVGRCPLVVSDFGVILYVRHRAEPGIFKMRR